MYMSFKMVKMIVLPHSSTLWQDNGNNIKGSLLFD